MSDLDVIRELEKELVIKLKELDNTNYRKNGYMLNGNDCPGPR